MGTLVIVVEEYQQLVTVVPFVMPIPRNPPYSVVLGFTFGFVGRHLALLIL